MWRRREEDKMFKEDVGKSVTNIEPRSTFGGILRQYTIYVQPLAKQQGQAETK